MPYLVWVYITFGSGRRGEINSAETMVQQIQKTYTHRCNRQICHYPYSDNHTIFHWSMKKLLLAIVFIVGCEEDAPILATDVEEFVL